MNITVGVVAFLFGLALVSSIAVNFYTQKLLEKCISILDYSFYLNSQTIKQSSLDEPETIGKEGTE